MLENSNKLFSPWERSDQISALEIVLFNIFINDLEEGINNEMVKLLMTQITQNSQYHKRCHYTEH